MVKLAEFIGKITGLGWEGWHKTGTWFPAHVLVRKRTQREEFERYVANRRKKYTGA